jgi:hypothetical protein
MSSAKIIISNTFCKKVPSHWVMGGKIAKKYKHTFVYNLTKPWPFAIVNTSAHQRWSNICKFVSVIKNNLSIRVETQSRNLSEKSFILFILMILNNLEGGGILYSKCIIDKTYRGLLYTIGSASNIQAC